MKENLLTEKQLQHLTKEMVASSPIYHALSNNQAIVYTESGYVQGQAKPIQWKHLPYTLAFCAKEVVTEQAMEAYFKTVNDESIDTDRLALILDYFYKGYIILPAYFKKSDGHYGEIDDTLTFEKLFPRQVELTALNVDSSMDDQESTYPDEHMVLSPTANINTDVTIDLEINESESWIRTSPIIVTTYPFHDQPDNDQPGYGRHPGLQLMIGQQPSMNISDIKSTQHTYNRSNSSSSLESISLSDDENMPENLPEYFNAWFRDITSSTYSPEAYRHLPNKLTPQFIQTFCDIGNKHLQEIHRPTSLQNTFHPTREPLIFAIIVLIAALGMVTLTTHLPISQLNHFLHYGGLTALFLNPLIWLKNAFETKKPQPYINTANIIYHGILAVITASVFYFNLVSPPVLLACFCLTPLLALTIRNSVDHLQQKDLQQTQYKCFKEHFQSFPKINQLFYIHETEHTIHTANMNNYGL